MLSLVGALYILWRNFCLASVTNRAKIESWKDVLLTAAATNN
jgi:hypothetical protein